MVAEALGSDLTDLYADVAEAAPKARIVVTGYPHLFEPVPRSVVHHAINAAIDATQCHHQSKLSASHRTPMSISTTLT